MSACPCCGSPRVASRRQLFGYLMDRLPPPDGFDWYGEQDRGALPPKSLFLQAGLLSLLALVPLYLASLAGLVRCYTFYVAGFSALALVLGALMADALYTIGRYRRWAGETLCGDCRASFVHDRGYIARP